MKIIEIASIKKSKRLSKGKIDKDVQDKVIQTGAFSSKQAGYNQGDEKKYPPTGGYTKRQAD